MGTFPKPPKTYTAFVERFPALGEAWGVINDAGREGPLDECTQRLLKLAVAVGAMRPGPVHSNTRKALAMGITIEEIEQVVALAAGTLGMPSTVAVWSWVREELAKQNGAVE